MSSFKTLDLNPLERAVAEKQGRVPASGDLKKRKARRGLTATGAVEN
jgi:hypothetical protein